MMFKNISGAKILVTGGAGFIGSNLTDFLLKQQAQVTVLDNFSTGKKENLSDAEKSDKFTLIEGDIRDPECCLQAAKGMKYIVHLAALGSVPRSIKDPATSVAVNVAGFVNILAAAQQCGADKVVYASSSSVYGDAPDLPKVESHTGKPLSPYALTKAVDELFAENFHRVYGLDSVGLRFFNVFGRRQDPQGAYAAVIPKFAAALLQHSAPVINGDGSFSRDFTYVDNVLQAIALAVATENREAVNQVYNVACGGRMTLTELFESLRQHLAVFDPEIAGVVPQYGTERAGDIPHSLADISKAVQLLGYKPEFSAAQGIAETAKWYFDNL